MFQKSRTQIKQCPNCAAEVKADFPEDMPGPLQYGTGLKAFAIHLIISQMVALNRVQKQISAMIGAVISEATLLKFVWRLYQALEQWEAKSIESILQAPSIHVDETSFRVNRKNHWIHVYSSGGITLKLLHRKRGKEAIVDSNQYRWARNKQKLLQETCRKIAKREDKCLTKKEYANLQKRYRNILTRGDKELPEIPPKPKGKRGKMAKSDAHNLWERLKEHETAVLLFAKEPYVPFTNNRAERDLRMAKVKQKVSGCFRHQRYADAYCRIPSYLQTMANKGVNPLVAIQLALASEVPDVDSDWGE
nr:transposase [uncultured Desulfobacter sp.]